MKSLKTVLYILAISTLMFGCKESDRFWNLVFEKVPTNQAVLGLLADADVYAYQLSDLSEPIEGPRKTSGCNESISLSGRFFLLLKCIPDDEWILLKVSGGNDIDVDNDGNIDEESTPNKGAIYCLAKAGEIRKGLIAVTPLSDYLFLKIKQDHDLSQLEPSALLQMLDDLSKSLLTKDLTNDGNIDYNDVLRFNPYNDKTTCSEQWDIVLHGPVSTIHTNHDESTRLQLYDSIFTNISEDVLGEDFLSESVQLDNGSIELSQNGDSSIKCLYSKQAFSAAALQTTIIEEDGITDGYSKIVSQGVIFEMFYPLSNQNVLSNSIDALIEQGSIQILINESEGGITIDIPKDLITSWSNSAVYCKLNGNPYEPAVILDDPKIEVKYSDASDAAEYIDLLKIGPNDPRCFRYDLINKYADIVELDNCAIFVISREVYENENFDLYDDFIDPIETLFTIASGPTTPGWWVSTVISNLFDLTTSQMNLAMNGPDLSNDPSDIVINKQQEYFPTIAYSSSRLWSSNVDLSLKVEASSMDNTTWFEPNYTSNPQGHLAKFKAIPGYVFVVVSKTPLNIYDAAVGTMVDVGIKGETTFRGTNSLRLYMQNIAQVKTWYKDADGDKYSDGTTQISTTQPADYYLAEDLIATSGDCNDNNANIYPGHGCDSDLLVVITNVVERIHDPGREYPDIMFTADAHPGSISHSIHGPSERFEAGISLENFSITGLPDIPEYDWSQLDRVRIVLRNEEIDYGQGMPEIERDVFLDIRDKAPSFHNSGYYWIAIDFQRDLTLSEYNYLSYALKQDNLRLFLERFWELSPSCGICDIPRRPSSGSAHDYYWQGSISTFSLEL